ncbi:LpqB family beta-propeller domain-containing protein [Sinomonas sp. ASV322]|uniref:LpqB family beta-propeller domain-containing protein n=1 Tax=Sinomonas sp. ASV322 TaxID=3041920 RepID=UPI0027DC7187|nr:LpqB family beta-propeller domain-containing protein [Sinomonas sp. ASV322]MDQ4503267.1 LpqB family beta-propeller domain-containing protein [Sinomonas sp. ASV322]
MKPGAWTPRRRVARRGRPAAVARSVLAVLAALVAVVGLVATAGCAQIPTASAVGTSKDGGSVIGNAPQYIPPGPLPGAGPQAIIEGFFNAGSGYQNDFTVARQFLAPATAVSWKPSQRTLVYRGSASVVPSDRPNTYRYELDVSYSVDQDGNMTQFPPGTKQSVEVEAAQVDGQWRLSKLPDGTVIPEETFKNLYRPFSVYFFDTDFSVLVPDVRWFIDNSGVAKSLVSALIGGPAPYLKTAVGTAFPVGIKLERESVPIVGNLAQVDLTAELRDTSFTDRQRMHSQLMRTLSALPTVGGVALRTNQTEVAIEDPASGKAPEPIVDPKVPSWQVGIADGQIVQYGSKQTAKIDGLGSAGSFGPEYPATAASQHLYAFLGADGKALYSVLPGQSARLLDSRQHLSPPSVSPSEWVWTAGPGANGATEVVAFRPVGTPAGSDIPRATVSAPWLSGRVVKSLRVARDGVRVLVLSEANGQSQLQVAGVVRAQDGTPKALTGPLTLPVTVKNPELALWVDEVTIVVSGTSTADPVAPELVSLQGGDPRQLSPLNGIQSISAGNGDQSIYAVTRDGIFLLMRTSWTEQGKGASQLAFAG